MAKTSEPIFKAHNPGCNCCPEDEDEPGGRCTTLYLFEMWWYITGFQDGASGNYRCFANPTVGGISSGMFGTGGAYQWNIYGPGLSTFEYWTTQGTWSIAGSIEDCGGDSINGDAIFTNESSGESAVLFRANGRTPSDMTCCCRSFWGPQSPSFTITATEYRCSAFGGCRGVRDGWKSGGNIRVRFSKPLWCYVSPEGFGNLAEGPLGTMSVRRIYGMTAPNNWAYDPSWYWPWEPCEE